MGLLKGKQEFSAAARIQFMTQGNTYCVMFTTVSLTCAQNMVSQIFKYEHKM